MTYQEDNYSDYTYNAVDSDSYQQHLQGNDNDVDRQLAIYHKHTQNDYLQGYTYSPHSRIARELNIPFVIGILVFIMAATCGGILLYSHIFQQKLVLTYTPNKLYAVGVKADASLDYPSIMQHSGYAGYQYNDFVVASLFDSYASAIMSLEDIIGIVPLAEVLTIARPPITTNIDSNEQGLLTTQSIAYYYDMINILGRYPNELSHGQTSQDSIRVRLNNITLKLASHSNILIDSSLPYMTGMLAHSSSILNDIQKSSISSHTIHRAICMIYLD